MNDTLMAQPPNAPPAPLPAATATASEQIYGRVYQVLVAGMLASTGLFALGLARALYDHETVPLSTSWIRAQYDAGLFWQGLIHARAGALLMAATLLLILTPVARVVVSIYAFAIERDLKFVTVTGTVLGVILLTIVLAKLGLVSPEGVRPTHRPPPTGQMAHRPAP